MATAQALLDRASIQLHDETGVDWPDSELLGYLNEALADLVSHQPGEFASTETVTHTTGVRQTLPAGAVALLRVQHALTPTGAASRAATMFNFIAMDTVSPIWRRARPGPVRQWAYDPRDPRVYWVYPPSDGSQALIELVREPQALTSVDPLPVSVRFNGALLDYVLYRAYSKDTEYAGQDGRAALHYQAYRGVVSGGSS